MVDIRYYIDGWRRCAVCRMVCGVGAGGERQDLRGAIASMEQGNFSNAKGVERACWNTKSIFWPGYRVYSGETATRSHLLTGGTKKRQHGISIRQRRTGGNYKLSKRGRR